MGLLTGLLTLPLAPVRGVAWIAEQVQTVAEAETTSEDTVSQRLAEIQAAWEAGEISTERRAELETEALGDLLMIDGEDW